MAGNRTGIAWALLAALALAAGCDSGGGRAAPAPEPDPSTIPIAHPTGSSFEIPTQGVDGPVQVKVDVLRAGNGKPAYKGAMITMNYAARAPGKKPYDSTAKRGEARELAVGFGQPLPGWDAALLHMRAGDSWKITVPAGAAFGKHGGPGIPPGTDIEVECEVLTVE